MDTIKRMGDKNLEENIKRQIQELRLNIDNALVEYSGFLDNLVKLKDQIVAEEFDEYSKVLGNRKFVEQIKIAGLVKRQYEQYRTGNKNVNAGIMGAACEAVLG